MGSEFVREGLREGDLGLLVNLRYVRRWWAIFVGCRLWVCEAVVASWTEGLRRSWLRGQKVVASWRVSGGHGFVDRGSWLRGFVAVEGLRRFQWAAVPVGFVDSGFVERGREKREERGERKGW